MKRSTFLKRVKKESPCHQNILLNVDDVAGKSMTLLQLSMTKSINVSSILLEYVCKVVLREDMRLKLCNTSVDIES